MILPVPNPNSVQFVDTTYCKYIFDDLERPYSKELSSGSLYIHKLGSYAASIATDINDLDLLNPSVFGPVSVKTKEILKLKYDKYGFVVCKLEASASPLLYHPFAYIHNIHDSKLFAPTFGTTNYVLYSYNTSAECNNCAMENDNFKTVNLSPFNMGIIHSINKMSINSGVSEDTWLELVD
jgi:hypothetical protein